MFWFILVWAAIILSFVQAIYWLRNGHRGWAAFYLICALVFIIPQIIISVPDTYWLSPQAAPLGQPRSRVIEGVLVHWDLAPRTCPQGVTCHPCYLPHPWGIPQADGTVGIILSYGCTPDTYKASGHESLNDINTRFAKVENNNVCANQQYVDHPNLILPEGTVVGWC